MPHQPPTDEEIRDFSPDKQPRLIAVIDTEEEFPWNKPHSRAETKVSAMREVVSAQEIFDDFSLVPVYVIDYPVASQPEGYEPLLPIADSGRCIVGSHLHPWVTPPFEEEVNAYNSFPGNLDAGLEFRKLECLTEKISENFQRPTIYKAGRYGLGPNSADVLKQLGYKIDLSPTPAFNYVSELGPDFTRHPNSPFLWDDSRLCIPCTGAFLGIGRGFGDWLYPLTTTRVGSALRVGGIFSRLGVLERVRLTPEGFNLDDIKRLSVNLLEAGVRTFTLSFHSPSLKAGCTPYVRNELDRAKFLDQIAAFLEFFFKELDGIVSNPLEIYEELTD